MPNVKEKAQYAAFVGDAINKCFDNKKDAVDHVKELVKSGKNAPWSYNVYKLQQVWSAYKRS